ncbi:MAG: hypothetical protein K9G11_01520 [Rickettsiaceae bacterium]|nr:hypothetical protein [Rickettsiaceae bacterium]
MVYLELTIIVVGALCQGKERNDSITLPLGDFTTFLTDSTFQHITINLSPSSPHSNISLQIHPLQPNFSHVCALNL